MELLTGKALADFDKWLISNNEYVKIGMYPFNSIAYMIKDVLPDYMCYCKVIEWLDSVGVYLMIGRYGYAINIDDFGSWNRKGLGCRFEITQQAIIHANKIYNER